MLTGHTFFISDLHLCDTRPAITQAFVKFLHTQVASADALYILGDLFEYWPGDDCIATSPEGTGFQAESLNALRALTQTGVPVFVLHGNRDFLLGNAFAKYTGVQLLGDPTLLNLYGKRVLLSHGDALCTDDVSYQQFRSQVRNPVWQAQFLAQELSQRLEIIAKMRDNSMQAKAEKSMQIMDVNTKAVNELLADYDYPPLFIHGHTHRPNSHVHQISSHVCTRWVLGDWYEQGSYLTLSSAGVVSKNLAPI